MNKKVIKLNEIEFKNLLETSVKHVLHNLNEGIEWTRSYGYGNGRGKSSTMNLRINQKTSDQDNQGGKMNADTRVFGTRDTILQGDGTRNKHALSLSQRVNVYKNLEVFYNKVLEYCDGKISYEEIPFDTVPTKQANTIQKKISDGIDPEDLKQNVYHKLNKISFDANVRTMTHDRIANSTTPEKVKRYNIGIVPGTNVRFIALYNINDFNFSDALKHGNIRQNDRTEEILGFKDNSRGARIPVTYDDSTNIGNVVSNFSLSQVEPFHYKTQYGLGDKKTYTSIHQFLDKSIIYAASALKEQNFIPDYIVAPPSSSKFNYLYCTNLSRKLGCEFINNFFQKSPFKVKINGGEDTEIMKKHGFTDKDIFMFENKIKGLAFKHISNEIRTPIYEFVTNPVFKNRIIEAGNLLPILKNKTYEEIVEYIIDDIFCKSIDYVKDKTIAQLIINKGVKNVDYKGVLGNTILNQKTRKPLDLLHSQVAQLLEKYSQILISQGGFNMSEARGFKITDFDKRERVFLSDCYVVADSELSRNGGLLTRYKNKNILIFDEDINSGGTLKMTISALSEQTNDPSNKHVMCLCNAYSSSGK